MSVTTTHRRDQPESLFLTFLGSKFHSFVQNPKISPKVGAYETKIEAKLTFIHNDLHFRSI